MAWLSSRFVTSLHVPSTRSVVILRFIRSQVRSTQPVQRASVYIENRYRDRKSSRLQRQYYILMKRSAAQSHHPPSPAHYTYSRSAPSTADMTRAAPLTALARAPLEPPDVGAGAAPEPEPEPPVLAAPPVLDAPLAPDAALAADDTGRSKPWMPFAAVPTGPGGAVALAQTPFASGPLGVGCPGSVAVAEPASETTASQEPLPVAGALIELCACERGDGAGAGGAYPTMPAKQWGEGCSCAQ